MVNEAVCVLQVLESAKKKKKKKKQKDGDTSEWRINRWPEAVRLRPLPHLSESKAFWEFNNGLHERRKKKTVFVIYILFYFFQL